MTGRNLTFRAGAVLLGVMCALGLLEGTCFLLNRSRWKNAYHNFAARAPHQPDTVRRYEIPNSAAMLARVPNPTTSPGPTGVQNQSRKYDLKYLRHDKEALVGEPYPGVSVRSLVTNNITGKVIYDVRYQTDRFGRRRTPQTGVRGRKKHLLLLGCSFVFGEGVNDGETLPSRLAALAPDYHVYNLGFHGYSPSSLFVRARSSPFIDGIRERFGIAAYVFLGFHVNRTLGTMSEVVKGDEWLPLTKISESGEVQYRGRFRRVRPWLLAFYRLVWASETRRFFEFDLPILTRESFHEFALYVKALKNEYKKRTGSDSFYVVIYPGERLMVHEVVAELEEMKIPYLDYSNLPLRSVSSEPVTIPYDGHPTAKANEILAGLLRTDLLSIGKRAREARSMQGSEK